MVTQKAADTLILIAKADWNLLNLNTGKSKMMKLNLIWKGKKNDHRIL